MTESLLDIALHAGGMAAWQIDFDARAIQGSQAFYRMIDQPEGTPLGIEAFERLVFADDVPAFRAALDAALRGERMQCDVRVRFHDGRVRGVLMSGRCIRDGDGRARHAVGVMRSRDDLRTMDRFTREGPWPWGRMFDATAIGMAQADPQSGRMLQVNARLATMVGCKPGDLVGARLLSLVYPQERGPLLSALRKVNASNADSFEGEQRLLHRAALPTWGLFIVNVLRDASGAPSRWMVLVIDISERKRAEETLHEREEQLQRVRAELERRVERRTAELANANAALLREIADRREAESQVRELLTRLVEGVEDERRRISRELHDTLGQHLAVLSIGIKSLETDLSGSPDAGVRLARVQSALNAIEDQLDRITHELRPPALDDLGLAEAVRSHVEQWSRESGIAAELHTHGLRTGRLSPTVENTVYRVVQEALTNVHRHAQATRVGVIIERRLDELRVVVEDNGCGFDIAQPANDGRRHMGLRGMSERASLVAGSLEIESVPGRGTTIYLVIPVTRESDVSKIDAS